MAVPPPLGPTTLFNVPPELAGHPDYEVVRQLGRGGMGIVYLSRHRLSGRMEVLKVMNKAVLGRADSKERFLREIQAAARLDHKNVVKMYTALELGELMVLVMEYVPGEDLAEVVKEGGPLPVVNACYYVQQAAAGLQHAFEKGMIHRDLKPHNLMLAREGEKHQVKVLDFGLAKATRGEDVDTGLTGSGVMVGTPGYVAPEQILDAASADIRADIYSLGCTLYHLLVGTPPFAGRSLFDVLQAHRETEAPSLHRRRAEVPEALAAVVQKMMAKEARQRYQTPTQVECALEPFVKGTLTPLRHRPTPPREGQRDAAPSRVIQRTKIEGTASTGKERSRLLPPNPSPPTRNEGEGTIARALRRENSKGSRKWLVVPLLVVLPVGLLGLWAIYGSRGPTTNKAVDEVVSDKGEMVKPASEKGPPLDVPEPQPPIADLVAKIKQVSGIDIVRIPAGGFYMGSEKGDADAKANEKPQHKVRISGPFWLGKYKVTVAQFKRFVGATGYATEPEKDKNGWTWRKPGFDQADEHPVVCVSWNDAKAYCAWLAEKTGASVRLPREAEWEYSCRARPTTKDWVTTKYYFGDNAADLGKYAWFGDNTNSQGTRPCGQLKPNPFGLYDMHGLVWEWCDDGMRTYTDETETDPVGAGASRVIRGGAINIDPQYCRAAFRNRFAPWGRLDNLGFRVLVGR